MPLTPEVDKDVCMSSGRCVADYPTAFTFDDEELAEAGPDARHLDDADVLAAARNCPTEAIRVRTDDGDEVDPFAEL